MVCADGRNLRGCKRAVSLKQFAKNANKKSRPEGLLFLSLIQLFYDTLVFFKLLGGSVVFFGVAAFTVLNTSSSIKG
jgi:hypothetical protein